MLNSYVNVIQRTVAKALETLKQHRNLGSISVLLRFYAARYRTLCYDFASG